MALYVLRILIWLNDIQFWRKKECIIYGEIDISVFRVMVHEDYYLFLKDGGMGKLFPFMRNIGIDRMFLLIKGG